MEKLRGRRRGRHRTRHNQVCGMFGFFFTAERNVDRYAQVMACDVERFKRFFHGMLAEGIYFAPSAFEAGFFSAAHSAADIEATAAAARARLRPSLERPSARLRLVPRRLLARGRDRRAACLSRI